MSSPTLTNLSSLIEQPESRRRENADAQVEVRVYVAEYDVCKAAQKTKNTAGSGDLAGYLIRSSVVEPIRGLGAKLIDTWVAGGEDSDPETNPLPADEVSVQATNQGPRLERNPRYVTLTPALLALVEDALRAQDKTQRDTAYAGLDTLGQELVDKIRAGNESYYLATLRYSWVTHTYTVPNSTRGGYIEAIGGPLETYFTGTIAWLREADNLELQSGIWRLTSSWLGADAWDADIYA